MELRRAAVSRKLDQEIGDCAFAGFDAGLVSRIGSRRAARGPAEKGGRARNFEVVANLRRTDRRVLEADIVAMQEDQRLRLIAAVTRRLYDGLDSS